MPDKAVYTCPFVFDSIPDWHMTQQMCNKVVLKYHHMLKYCLDRYKTQEMCDKSVNSYLPALKFVLDCFVASKMVEKNVNGVFSNYCIFVGDINSDIVIFSSNDIDYNSINLNDVNYQDDNLDDFDPETINHARPMAWYNVSDTRPLKKDSVRKKEHGVGACHKIKKKKCTIIFHVKEEVQKTDNSFL